MDGYARTEDELFSSCLLNLTWENCYEQVSGGGGSFDYLRCRLIAFLNLCTDVLLHRPGACRTRPDGPLPGEKQTTPCF
ncbi:peroxisome proliferator-activated receptor gamma coactivator 1-alpha isoform X1 [Lates japonicus]|uniref:Peroxisome proliferator-activated receptor gamma coactivator 1-alpha isoform X1 n=1 Tax=Lates japonicus TaxID=270547 RepID=A0AAD3MGY6_LATJO|nr:peroxisome proliferator-activated receptor gamma coactivator 1-alpha isoform X1 [Lates japonicus]